MQPEVRYSPDGRWFWDGAQWRPVPPPAPHQVPPPGTQHPAGPRPEGMFWFFGVPEWIGPFLLTGLINIIPFVGQMVVLGWMLESRDYARQGLGVVPSAGFRYLGRGFRVWIGQLVYGLVFTLVVIVGVAVVVALSVNEIPWYGVLPVGLVFGGIAVLMALWLGYIFASQVSLIDRYSISTGINPGQVWRTATADSHNSWRAFAALLLGIVIVLLVSFTIGLVVPFASSFAVPAMYLMIVPALADFDETRAVAVRVGA